MRVECYSFYNQIYQGHLILKGRYIIPTYNRGIDVSDEAIKNNEVRLLDISMLTLKLPITYELHFLHKEQGNIFGCNAIIKFSCPNEDRLSDEEEHLIEHEYGCTLSKVQKVYLKAILGQYWVTNRENMKDFIWPSITAIVGFVIGYCLK